jgi:hypothetical protein
MGDLFEFCRLLHGEGLSQPDIKKLTDEVPGTYGIYQDSIQQVDGAFFFIALYQRQKVLVIVGENPWNAEFLGNETVYKDIYIKICELTNENNKVIRKIFGFTNPVNHHGINITIGLGDRLGLASPGHIQLLKGTGVFPVLAQQSIRELNLTGRTYEDVLCAASWAVFQEGYKEGFGADGDHLKSKEELKYAIGNGFTMITLDCSEHIDNSIIKLSDDESERLYLELPEDMRCHFESEYQGNEILLKDGTKLTFTKNEFHRTVLIYHKAVDYTIDVFNNIIKKCGRNIDFEMSIDETLTPTSPYSHYFVANELISAGVVVTSLAPRFCGEFQKGIDYRGNVEQFEYEFERHYRIAEHFGYKISVHSGSDKFTVFPIIGRITGGKYHLKTAGTNWLEAVRVIAHKEPGFFRKMYEFGLKMLPEARKYYHISADEAKAPAVGSLKDEELPKLLDIDDTRQIIHITYGLILMAKNPNGMPALRDGIYEILGKYEQEYYDTLIKHIGKHLDCLGI